MNARARYDSRDVLVESGRSWRSNGAVVRNYVCGWDRIAARVSAERVELKRQFGVVCPGINVALAELDQLVVFLQ
jgi:hypothetical protein